MKIKKLFTMTVSSVLLALVLMLTGILGMSVSYASEMIGGIEYTTHPGSDGRDYYYLAGNGSNLALELNKSTRILEKGMSGDDVVLLQMLLYNLKYLDATPDGVFDARTEAAVKDFQLGNALGYSNGKADDKTKRQFLLDNVVSKGSPLYERNVASARNGWVQDGGKYYYFINGTMQTGFVQDGGKYYYFNKTNGSLQTGWVQDGGKYYYFSKTNGSLQTGFVQDGGKYYYFNKTKGSLQTGWVQDGGKYYYFSKTNGSLQTGWVQDGGKYYYFDPSTGALKTGWLQYGGKYYYLSPVTGNPVTGKQTIDGKTYTFNSNGVCMG